MTDLKSIEKKITEENYRITKEEALELYETASTEELTQAANRIREKCSSRKVNICSIINAKQGSCSENCKYCAQSAHWKTSCTSTAFVGKDEVINFTKRAAENKVSRISLVAAGRGTKGEDFEKAIECFKAAKEAMGDRMKFCASLGIISYEQMVRLREAGVVRYHHNIETCENFYQKICTTHTYRERTETIMAAKKAGLDICCGGIIGLGESREDRIDFALAIRELDVQSVPVNVLTAIKGTPLENLEPLSEDEILRTFAIFRFIMPSQVIRCAAGRKKLGRNGEKAFMSGANALISGDFLTVPGSDNREDVEMLESLGYEIVDN